jgi:tetratricopeptide (TPR) repeat protein
MLTAVLAIAVLGSELAAQRGSLTGLPEIRAVYQSILDARFDHARDELRAVCAPAGSQAISPEACALLDLVTTWWQIQLDPRSPARDPGFLRRSDEAIALAEAWAERAPDHAEAWFYLGAAYGARAQFEGLRGERLAAARDGSRIKASLERAVVLDPELHDARFGIGLYHYYADVAPPAARILRWILLLPGGDRERGLREMLDARENSQLLRDEADYQLHQIYLWYEDNTPGALAILHRLAEAHPSNPLFPQRIAEIEDAHLSDHAASLETWRRLLDAATSGRVAEPRLAETRARLGLARELDHLFETDAAIEQLRHVIAAAPDAPYGSASLARLLLAQALDRIDRRDEALDTYRAARATIPGGDPHDIARQAAAGLRRAPPAAATGAYRLSLEGWRALERRELKTAADALARSLELDPSDQVAQYRWARLLDARGETRPAIDRYESVMSEPSTPPVFFAAAALDAARLYAREGDRARANELFERARTSFGASTATREAATRALAQLDRSPSGFSR